MGADRLFVHQFWKDPLGQLFAQLDPPLVKAEDVPDHPLDKDLVFIHGDEAPQDSGCHFLEENRIRRPVPFKNSIRIESLNLVVRPPFLSEFLDDVFLGLTLHQGLGLCEEVR